MARPGTARRGLSKHTAEIIPPQKFGHGRAGLGQARQGKLGRYSLTRVAACFVSVNNFLSKRHDG